jgi:hypothetical protein
MTLPVDASGKTHVEEGNFTGALSGVSANATNTRVTLSFTLNSAIGGLSAVTRTRVGTVPRANESIAADVTTDFFSSSFGSPLTAGPFASARGGANTVTLWPPAGQTVPTPPAPPSDVPVNLARGGHATASYQDGSLLAANAIDGNPSSRWSSDHSNDNNAWAQVDLGGAFAVSHVVLSWETAFARAYRVQVSDNGTQWTYVFSTTTGTGGTATVPVNRTTRYVRMQGVTPNTQWGYSLWEFEIYGTGR